MTYRKLIKKEMLPPHLNRILAFDYNIIRYCVSVKYWFLNMDLNVFEHKLGKIFMNNTDEICVIHE